MRVIAHITLQKDVYVEAFRLSRRCTQWYNTGNTNNVNNVDETMPPITTVANGRCTAPVPVFKCHGHKTTSAALSTGRRQISVSSTSLAALLNSCFSLFTNAMGSTGKSFSSP